MSEERVSLTIVSYNIHKGFSSGNRRFVLNEIKAALEETEADLVFLQEVHGEHKGHANTVVDWPTASQFEFLASSIWPHFVYGKNHVYVLGHHGNAVLSRYPIIAWENIDVSAHQFESRGLLHAVLDVPGVGGPVHAVCVHLGLSEGGRKYQLGRLCSLVEEAVPPTGPLIVAGDFNDWSVRATRRLTRALDAKEVFKSKAGRHARTFPSWFPVLQLDRVYCRGFNVLDAKVLTGEPWRRLSDHAALYAVLEPSPCRHEDESGGES